MKDDLIKTIKREAAKGIAVSQKGIIALKTPNSTHDVFQAFYGDVSRIDYYVKKGRIVYLRCATSVANPQPKWHCTIGPEITEVFVPEDNVAFYSYDKDIVSLIEEVINKK